MRYTFLAFLALFICLTALAALPSLAQAPRPRPSDPQFEPRRNEQAEEMTKMEKEQEKKRNEQRQESLKKDTDKLLVLATELKQYVDKSNEHLLSLDVIKKAEEIEKLSKQVQKKMRAE